MIKSIVNLWSVVIKWLVSIMSFVSADDKANGKATRKPRVNKRFFKRFRGNKYVPHQGYAERERRRKQIEKGMLNYENGLRKTPQENITF